MNRMVSNPLPPSHRLRNWKLEPRKTALLVVDVQMSEVSPETERRYPDYVRTVHERVVPNIRRLIDELRGRGVEIVYTVMESMTKDGRDSSLDYKLSEMIYPKGGPLSKVVAGIAPGDDDILLPKSSSGVFNSTNLDYLLRNMGIENLIVVGVLSGQCVDMAVRDGADRGYYMVCVHDACAAHTDDEHIAALRAFGGYCRLQTSDELLETFVDA
jgi:nicotinamidase-related amidase